MHRKEIISRKDFLKKLKKKLRFKYNKDDVSSILNDYNEFFDIEVAKGKTEKEVCMSLGEPTIIVKSLNQELLSRDSFYKHLSSRMKIIQCAFLVIIFSFILHLICKLRYAYDETMLKKMLIIYPLIALSLWLVLIKANGNYKKKLKTNKKIKSIHLICFLSILFIYILLNNIVVNKENYILKIAYEQTGHYLILLFSLLIVLLCAIILYSIYQFNKGNIVYYSVICHAIGILAIIFYYINVLHSFTDLGTYSFRIMESGFIYLEMIVMNVIFFTLEYKRGL